MEEEIQAKAIQTAFCWTRYNYYGSEANAAKSLLKRKGIKGISTEDAIGEIKRGIQILEETEILIRSEINNRGKNIDQFTEAEIKSFSDAVRVMLQSKFSEVSLKAFDYAIGMLIMMPYYR